MNVPAPPAASSVSEALTLEQLAHVGDVIAGFTGLATLVVALVIALRELRRFRETHRLQQRAEVADEMWRAVHSLSVALAGVMSPVQIGSPPEGAEDMPPGTRMRASYSTDFEVLANESNAFLRSWGAIRLYGLPEVDSLIQRLWRFRADILSAWMTLVVTQDQGAPGREYRERVFGQESVAEKDALVEELRVALRKHALHEDA